MELALAMLYSDVVIERMNAFRKTQGLAPLATEPRPDAELSFAQSYEVYSTLSQRSSTQKTGGQAANQSKTN